MKHKNHIGVFILAFCILAMTSQILGQIEEKFDESLLKNSSYRAIGPARQGGRIVDIAVALSEPYTFYAATASGGLWKTMNNGTTFEPLFDNQSVISIGDIDVAPSNPNIVWVGTGEANNSRSSYWGDGVYKSIDGGKSWRNMGLRDTHHIGRIIIHPQNPEIVYVAALGHLYSSNEERGLFKTTNGGKTWEKVLYINEKVGVVDVAIDPGNPDILYAASYEKSRMPWTFEESGPGSAIYKSNDAGKTWKKLGGDLPSGMIGRIGIDVYRKNPNILYATIENSNLRPPTEEETKQDQNRKLEPQQRLIGGEVYCSRNGGETWRKVNSSKDDIGGHPGYYYGQIRIDPIDENTIYVLSVSLYRSKDGGKSWGKERPENAGQGTHSDHHALWIDPQNSNHLLLGNDGGLAQSYDGGASWDFYDNLPLAQYYTVGVDMEDPYNIYGGLQDNGSWKGPSNSLQGEITLDDWEQVGGGDGMYNQVDPIDSRWLYNESQFGNIQRLDQRLWIRKNIRPSRKEGEPALRFNWSSPILISPHNSQIIFMGANVLFRSLNRGDSWQEISPDLTTNDPAKTKGKGNIQYCTITTISESPLSPGTIWVGTDDGNVQLTRNGGAFWINLSSKIKGAPANYWVSRVLASNFKEGTAYLAKTGYRHDDFRPFLFKTNDFGATWTSIASNLPNEPVNVLIEDRKNPNLLFVGTEMAVYVSIDSGGKWVRMKNNMPTNAVHDLLVHPRENDLVVATHGRGIFITDITPLQEMTPKVLAEDVYLFKVEPKTQSLGRRSGGLPGHRHFQASNEPLGTVINYYLKEKAEGEAKITISDLLGKELNQLKGKAERGVNSVIWNMREQPRQEEIKEQETMMRFDQPAGKLVSPGEYLVTLEVGGKKLQERTLIRPSPGS